MPSVGPTIEINESGKWVVLDARIIAKDKNVCTIVFSDPLRHPKDFDGARIRVAGVEAVSAVGQSKSGDSVSVQVTLPVKRLGA